MKKTLVRMMITLISLLLTACSNEDTIEVKVVTPGGGPTLAIVEMIHEFNSIDDYDISYDVLTDPSLLPSKMSSKSHEIVIAPTNMGANLYNKGSNYLYGGTITFGNLYLVGTQDINLSDIGDEEIVSFGKDLTPDIIFKEVLKYKNVYNESNITYKKELPDANLAFNKGDYEYALLAEPVLSVTKKKFEDQGKELYVIADLQEVYQEMTQKDHYPQAGIFINGEFYKEHQELIEQFLTKLEESTNFVNENKEIAAQYYIDEGLMPEFPKPVLIQAIPGSNIGFLSARNSKELLDEYYNMLYDINPNLIGGKLPDEDFYIK